MFRFWFGVLVGWFAATLYFENDRDVAATLRSLQERADGLMNPHDGDAALPHTNGRRRAARRRTTTH